MILVFGGTTEGRRAVAALEEAGTPYYYSTRTAGQEVELVNGRRLTGPMDTQGMVGFCRKHDIRLLIDAAHPFAVELHRNVLEAARQAKTSIIRFERRYPSRSSDMIWCEDYDDALRKLEEHGIERLLALTGVQTIGRLRRYWQRHECWWRILDRRISLVQAQQNQFPEDRLVYYEQDDTAALLERLRPQAILTKESGESGGFDEKVEAARKAGVLVFVVERPKYPVSPDVCLEMVDGEHGLRRAVERLLPDFYPLKSGLTTGTCATAAALAAATRRLTGNEPSMVIVTLPNGEHISVPVSYGDGYAFVVKEAGDDPDVTNGLEIRADAKLRLQTHPAGEEELIAIEGGDGVGRFTLPGFDYPPGEAAINKAPRQMIRQNLAVFRTPLTVTISVPQGEEIARKTFNPRLSIEGGISIIGVSGIVKPFSEEAFKESIMKCMQVAKASNAPRVVIHSGGKSERFLHAVYPELPGQAFVEYGNYIGDTIRMAAELDIEQLTLGIMLGKAVKLAAGHLDTHSKRVVMDKPFVQQMLQEAGIDIDISALTLARELWTMVPAAQLQMMADAVIDRCLCHCQPLLPKGKLTVLLISDEGEIYSRSMRTESV